MILLWPLSGFIGLIFFLFAMPTDTIEKITLKDIVQGIFFFFLALFFGPISFLAGIGCWWDEKNIGQITIWERKTDKVERLQKQAKKMGFELKGIDE